MVLQSSPQEYFSRRVSATVVSPPAFQEPIIPSPTFPTQQTLIIDDNAIKYFLIIVGTIIALAAIKYILKEK